MKPSIGDKVLDAALVRLGTFYDGIIVWFDGPYAVVHVPELKFWNPVKMNTLSLVSAGVWQVASP